MELEVRTWMLYLYISALIIYGLFLLDYTIASPYYIPDVVGHRVIYAIATSLLAFLVFTLLTYYILYL